MKESFVKLRFAVLVGVLAALALPAAAQAGLPKPSTILIVPAKSLGGVSLGGSTKSVTKAWGQNKKCEYSCVYEGKNTSEAASVQLESKNNGVTYKAWLISISVGYNKADKPIFNTKLTEFETSSGIGLGSKTSELTKAYKHLEKNNLGGGVVYYTLKGKGTSGTTFLTTKNKITSISVYSHQGG
jgi:hypothetical protein